MLLSLLWRTAGFLMLALILPSQRVELASGPQPGHAVGVGRGSENLAAFAISEDCHTRPRHTDLVLSRADACLSYGQLVPVPHMHRVNHAA
ncbi:protein of unknown function [Caballeronia sp. S22]